MKYALVNNVKSAAKKGLKGICEICTSAMIAKCGAQKIHHWAHKKSQNCDPWWETETEWHRHWKNQYPESYQEIIVTDSITGKKHRADIKTPENLTIEFQYSPITLKERKEREASYKNLIWVVNGTRLKNDIKRFNKHKIQLIPKVKINNTIEKGMYIVPKKDFEGLFPKNWMNYQAPVLFDFNGEIDWGKKYILFCLMPTINVDFYVVAQITYKQFIDRTINGDFIDRWKRYKDDQDESKINMEKVEKMKKFKRHW